MTRPPRRSRSGDGALVLIEEREGGGEGALFQACSGHGSRVDGDVEPARCEDLSAKVCRSRCSESRRAAPRGPRRPSATASTMAQSGASGRCVHPARALLGDLGEVGERPQDVRGVDVSEAERAHARRVDHPAAAAVAAVSQRHGRAGCVPPAPGDHVHVADGPARIRHELVHEGRLADSGMPDEDRGVPDEGGADALHGHLVAARS